jgi:hypothetical protein
VAASLTPCRACARHTQTLEDRRCEHCGQRKPLPVAPTRDPTAPPAPPASLWEDIRPQLVAAAVGLVIAIVGLVAGSALLLIAAAVILVVAAVQKIVADGW